MDMLEFGHGKISPIYPSFLFLWPPPLLPPPASSYPSRTAGTFDTAPFSAPTCIYHVPLHSQSLSAYVAVLYNSPEHVVCN